ncbi:MAG: TonB-dependent receptor [Saprospiraceae bacterium]|nr:TonB-dependent receptor [Saprospiraceae bacterium]
MKYCFRFFILPALLLLGIELPAQISISGTVTAADTGEPLLGVNILVEGTATGTITDLDGQFELDVPNEAERLVVSYVGYQTINLPLNGQTVFQLVMQNDNVLEEVVVVGYGVQRKSDLTGSISSLDAEEIQRIPSGNVEQALQGKVAGVQVTPASGRPGAGAIVRIRGIGTFNDASPLYVVDGMLLNDISFLAPDDIESLEVLKDASATAIYGSRGANGVIIISTKKGKVGGDATISVSAYHGVQEVANRLDLVNAAEYAQLVNELSVNEGGGERYSDPGSFGEGTDWQDVIFQSAPIRNVQVGANGGTESMIYNVSFNYFAQEGIIRGSDYERFTIRINNEYRLKKYMRWGHNLALTYTESENGPGVLTTAYRSSPIAPVYDSLGNFSPLSAEISSTANAEASFFYNNSNSLSYRGVGNIYLDIMPFEGLIFRSNLGLDLSKGENKSFVPVFEVSAIQQNQDSRLNVGNTTSRSWLWENTLTYQKEWKDHRINVLGGITSQAFDFEQISGSRLNLIGEDESFFFLNAGDETTSTVSNSADTWSILSYLFRLNYTLMDRYLLTVSYRADGSSKFGANNRFGYFPSVALGWNLTGESFMEGQTAFSRLKLRGSWGQVGNEKIGTFRYSPLVTSNLNVIFGPDENLDNVQNGAAVLNLANPDLRWEETTQLDFGVEFGLLGNRLSAEIDYYSRTTSDILAAVPIPDYIGSEQNPVVNAAEMRNSGFDFNLSWRESRKQLEYSINVVASTVNNEVLSIGGGREDIFGGGLGFGGWLGTRTIIGAPIGSFYGWKVAGVFQNEEELGNLPRRGSEGGVGDLRFEDTNGDGVITDDDRTFLGNPIPDFIYGLNLTVAYQGFDLAIEFNGQSGNEIFNSKKAARFGLYNFENSFLDRWTGPGTSNFEPRVTNSGHNYIPSDRFIEDGSFVRLRNIQLGYTLPNQWLQQLRLRDFRVYVSGTNLITWTDYSGYMPEVGSSSPFSSGIDRGIYPIAKTYTVGLNISF